VITAKLAELDIDDVFDEETKQLAGELETEGKIRLKRTKRGDLN
jgi:hypothetical protein